MSAAEQHIFGAMLILLHRHLADLSARGQVARGGRGARGTGLEGWLHQYAPAVKRPTALRWMKATHGLMAKAGVLTPEGLQRLLRSEAAELSEDDWVKQRDLFTLIENCSQNELLTPVPTKMEKARRLTGHEATNVLRTLCTNVGEHLRCLHSEKAYIALKDAELDGLIDHLEATLEDVRAWRKLPKTDREDALAEQIARQAKATRHPHAQH